MAVPLKAGARYKSAVCDTQIMVIKAPAGDYDLCCGGAAMLAPNEAAAGGALDTAFSGETLIGKRYVDPEEKFELLCTKAGKGSLSLGGVKLDVKQAKQLPSSD